MLKINVSHQGAAVDSCFGLIRPRQHGIANTEDGGWVPI